MSIVALARHRARQGRADVSEEPLRGTTDQPATDTAVLENIVRHIPSDAIAAYTTGLAFLAHEQAVYRWFLVVAMAIFSVALAVGVYRREVLAAGERFNWPIGLTAIVLFAFAVYVGVIPSSPLNEFSWYGPVVAGVIGLVGNAVLIVIALWTRDDSPDPP